MTDDIYQTLKTNQDNIFDIVEYCREALYNVLITCIDEQTNEYFDISEELTLTELCQQAKHIQSLTNNNAVTPPTPKIIESNSLYAKQKNIYNKIQYCNNLLRYALKKNGIDFGYSNSNVGCNKTRDLINFISQIDSVRVYSGYLKDLTLTENGDLLVTSITVEDLPDSDVITDIFFADGKLITRKQNVDDIEYDDIIFDIRLNNNDELIYVKVNNNKNKPIIIDWDDEANRDGLRPTSWLIKLCVGDEVVETAILDESTHWIHVFSHLEDDIDYNIVCDVPEGYTKIISGNSIILTHIPETTSCLVMGLWEDFNNIKRLRASSIEVSLKADNEIVKQAILSEANNWTHRFTNLPKRKNNENIQYTITHDFSSEYYTTSVTGTATNFNIKNTLKVGDINLNILTEGIPLTEFEDCYIKITGPDTSCPLNINLVDFTNNNYKIKNLLAGIYNAQIYDIPLNINYQDIEYAYNSEPSITSLSSYDLYPGDTLSMNLYLQYVYEEEEENPLDETTEIPVVVIFDDNNNLNGNRPSSIPITLLANGMQVAAANITGNSWSYTFSNLPKYNQSEEQINYTINVSSLNYYTTTIRGYTINVKENNPLKELQITKVWDDDNNAYNVRPSSLRVSLDTGQNCILNEANNWTDIVNVITYINKEEHNYNWTESEINSYMMTNKQVEGNITTITNKYTNKINGPEPK